MKVPVNTTFNHNLPPLFWCASQASFCPRPDVTSIRPGTHVLTARGS